MKKPNIQFRYGTLDRVEPERELRIKQFLRHASRRQLRDACLLSGAITEKNQDHSSADGEDWKSPYEIAESMSKTALSEALYGLLKKNESEYIAAVEKEEFDAVSLISVSVGFDHCDHCGSVLLFEYWATDGAYEMYCSIACARQHDYNDQRGDADHDFRYDGDTDNFMKRVFGGGGENDPELDYLYYSTVDDSNLDDFVYVEIANVIVKVPSPSVK